MAVDYDGGWLGGTDRILDTWKFQCDVMSYKMPRKPLFLLTWCDNFNSDYFTMCPEYCYSNYQAASSCTTDINCRNCNFPPTLRFLLRNVNWLSLLLFRFQFHPGIYYYQSLQRKQRISLCNCQGGCSKGSHRALLHNGEGVSFGDSAACGSNSWRFEWFCSEWRGRGSSWWYDAEPDRGCGQDCSESHRSPRQAQSYDDVCPETGNVSNILCVSRNQFPADLLHPLPDVQVSWERDGGGLI